MLRTTLRAALASAALIALSQTAVRISAAQDLEPAPDHITAPAPPAPAVTSAPCRNNAPLPMTAPAYIPSGLFANYYVGPPGVPAQLYPSPRPVPAYVGQVWITYPPFDPHEYLYHHSRSYYRYTPNGYTSARVRWH